MKQTDIFDKLDNVIGNHMEGKASHKDVVAIAYRVNKYLIEHTHPHDIIKNNVDLSVVSDRLSKLSISSRNKLFAIWMSKDRIEGSQTLDLMFGLDDEWKRIYDINRNILIRKAVNDILHKEFRSVLKELKKQNNNRNSPSWF